MMPAPMGSPWGRVQHCEELCQGAWLVSTAGHGGVMIDRQVALAILSYPAQKVGFWNGRYLCFEEDCAAPVAIRELMDAGVYQPPVNAHFKEGEYAAVIDASLQRWNPDYWRYHESEAYRRRVTPQTVVRLSDWGDR